jgi:glutamyl-tRNA synthetase
VDGSEIRALAREHALANALDHGGEADPGAVMGRIMADEPELRDRAGEVNPVVQEICADVSGRPVDEIRTELEEIAPEHLEEDEDEGDDPPLPDLPGDPDNPVMRFAPNPNGPATIGHARGMVVLSEYKDRYDGEVILRYDDTDPVIKAPEKWAYEAILDDYRWLGGDPDLVIKASERLETYYEWAEETIEVGGAYVCECTQEAFRERKNAGEACPHRDRTADESLEAWQAMLDGAFEPGEAVLRIRTDITHDDPALRDWVAFRIVDIDEHPHPVTGEAYHVWPMLDFQSAVDDHLAGVTHIIRGKDLMDSTRKQGFLYDHHGLVYPETLYWGRVSIHETGKFSTSDLKEAIARGEYEGWDDPRLPTLAALRRRGFQPEGIRSWWLDFGLTEKDVAASIETLHAENRKVLDPLADRFFLVADPVALEVQADVALEGEPPLHPDDADRGTRSHRIDPEDGVARVLVDAADEVAWEPGELVRLKDLGNVTYEGDGQATYEGDDLDVLDQDIDIVHWCPPDAVDATLRTADGEAHEGVAEPDVADLEPETVVQFERVGFARLEETGPDGVLAFLAHR